mmetsp:Transcript_52736/g.98728  ORF Transcript_52736/g.98728 Transcript_52736/m.98728 type:complete len:92 (+) Transcript_52736:134-409(+)
MNRRRHHGGSSASEAGARVQTRIPGRHQDGGLPATLVQMRLTKALQIDPAMEEKLWVTSEVSEKALLVIPIQDMMECDCIPLGLCRGLSFC